MARYDSRWVDANVAWTVDAWHDCARKPPGGGVLYTPTEQEVNERAYDEALEAVEYDLDRASEPGSDRDHLQDRLVASFGRFAARALGLKGEQITLLTDEFLPVGTGLARWAREFDPALDMNAIIQASRNAWTACGLQPLLGVPVELTPSILGYSLLYPYSDNYLDDERVSAQAKLQFSQRFRYRLEGEELPAEDEREQAIEALISLVEWQYPRSHFHDVFECLLAIHQAQERSIAQLQQRALEDDTGSLRVSCAKGGTSVLTDACLARGYLQPDESRFAFEWGVLLQLGDDLQDIRDDMRRGSRTLFSRAAAAGQPLDSLTVQLLNFSETVAALMDKLPHGTATLKDLLKMSWRSLIVRAVADSHEFFSSRFLTEAERWSPFRFEFLRERSGRLARREGVYAGLFRALLESPRTHHRYTLPTLRLADMKQNTATVC